MVQRDSWDVLSPSRCVQSTLKYGTDHVAPPISVHMWVLEFLRARDVSGCIEAYRSGAEPGLTRARSGGAGTTFQSAFMTLRKV